MPKWMSDTCFCLCQVRLSLQGTFDTSDDTQTQIAVAHDVADALEIGIEHVHALDLDTDAQASMAHFTVGLSVDSGSTYVAELQAQSQSGDSRLRLCAYACVHAGVRDSNALMPAYLLDQVTRASDEARSPAHAQVCSLL